MGTAQLIGRFPQRESSISINLPSLAILSNDDIFSRVNSVSELGQDELFEMPGQAKWHENLRAGFDLETTSPDPQEARIVTASLIVVDGAGNVANHQEWLVNPGVPIPPAASNIHGVTDERAQRDGLPAVLAVSQIAMQLTQLFEAEIPVVAFNASYDFTVMAQEAKRYHCVFGDPRPVIDPYVLDKQLDRYRRGKRTLADVASFYQVPLQNAHTSAADAMAAVGVADQIARYRRCRSRRASCTMLRSAGKEQATSLQEVLMRRDPNAFVDPRWPVALD